MNPARTICPNCGAQYPANGISGLCPACFLKQGAAGDTGPAAAFMPPRLAELARLFPQLEILGYTGEGLTMLLISVLTCFIGFPIMYLFGIIEGIIYLTKSDEDFVATYVSGKKGWF